MNEIIRIAINKRGLSSFDVAERIGVKVGTFRNTLARNTLTSSTLKRVSGAIGCEWVLWDSTKGIIYFKGGTIQDDRLKR